MRNTTATPRWMTTMDHLARVAFVNAQTACALADIESMKAANAERAAQGLANAYGEQDFLNVQSRYMIGHNAVIEFLRG